jgi:MFS family permease
MDYFKDIRIAFLFGTMISLATFPTAATLRRPLGVQRDELKQERNALGSNDVSSKSIDKTILAWSFLAIMLWGFLTGTVTNLFPVYSVMLGFSKTMTGMFSTIQSIAAVMAFWSVGLLSARLGKLSSILMGALSCAAIAIVPVYRDPASIALAMALFGLGTGIIHPTARGAVLELSSSRRGYYIGILEGLSTGGMSIGAVVGGALATYLNPESPYYFASLMAMIISLALFLLSKRKAQPPTRHNEHGLTVENLKKWNETLDHGP